MQARAQAILLQFIFKNYINFYLILFIFIFILILIYKLAIKIKKFLFLYIIFINLLINNFF